MKFMKMLIAGFSLACSAGTLIWCSAFTSPARAGEILEAPMLAPLVANGELPPVSERLPVPPAVAALIPKEQVPGVHGGEIETLMGRQKDIRLMTVYGYARLVGYDADLNLVSDIVEKIEVDDQRVFTFKLRKNHRWSDGRPFTAEDFSFYWEDVVNNEEISPFGPPKVLRVDGEVPRVEFIDAQTIRYSWSKPNPYFLPAIAGARPLYIYRPAHYLKQFHAAYASREELAGRIEEASARNWVSLFNRKDEQYRFDNIDLPVLQPWMNTTRRPAERFVFTRNPYYHRVDSAGRQLPYLDRVIVNISDSNLVPAKTGFGETDLQARHIRFDHYTFLKQGEKDKGYQLRLWTTASGSKVALYPNLTAEDSVWRGLMRDVRFRRALSIAINRNAINQVLYFGLAKPGADTVLPESPLYNSNYRDAWTQHDPKMANAFLDKIGLTERDSSGTRLLPDGRPMQIIIDTSGESTEETDMLELIKTDWSKIGIELFTKPSQREVFRNRVFAGQAIMSVWSGLDNALPTADTAPTEFAPTEQIQLQWSKWGEHFESSAKSGQIPDLPAAKELLTLYKDWRFAKTKEARAQVWHEILKIRADQVFSIGTINGVPQPVVVAEGLRNVPSKGIYSWSPSAYFGIYKMDTFWLSDDRRAAQK